MFVDLHMHSTYSDGTNTPRELVQIAADRGVKAMALTDHDGLQGIKELEEAAEFYGIQVIPGVEISTSIDGIRIHILGYNLDRNNKNLQKYLSAMSAERTDNTRKMLSKLYELNILNYTWEQVTRHHKKAWICSLDVFEAMRKDGFYRERSEWKVFYHSYFGKNSPVYLDLQGFTSKSAIEIILEAGGLPVVAHPKLIGDDKQLDNLVKYGLRGIEVNYPAHDALEREKYHNFAKNNNLFITGGTDWHGDFTEWGKEIGEYGIDIDSFKKIFLGK